jgi:integrase
VVGYHCGNRLGELRKLRWPQVDLAALEIRVTQGQAKGKKSRTLPIYGDMVEWLSWQWERRAAGCDLVFHWHGKPLGITWRTGPKIIGFRWPSGLNRKTKNLGERAKPGGCILYR